MQMKYLAFLREVETKGKVTKEIIRKHKVDNSVNKYLKQLGYTEKTKWKANKPTMRHVNRLLLLKKETMREYHANRTKYITFLWGLIKIKR